MANYRNFDFDMVAEFYSYVFIVYYVVIGICL